MIFIFEIPTRIATSVGIALLGHELVHVGQYAEGMTWLSYIIQGYEENPYELDAYLISDTILDYLKEKYGDKLPPCP